MKRLIIATVTRFSTKLILAWLTIFLVGPILADVKTKSDDKKSKNDIVIPEAREITKNFVAGQSAEVELVAAVGSLRQVTFIIREAPQHGTLSVVRPNLKESNKAFITYTHRDADVMSDKFTYACRVDDGPVSAPATVSLIGQVLEPKLEIIDAPRIGKVFLGGEESGVVTVKNTGVAPYISDLKWETPWIGPPRLEVKPGETQTFRLTFKPTQPGEYRMERLLQKGLETSKLVEFGECARALSVSPTNLNLVLNSSNGNREGTLTLFNNKLDPIQLSLVIPQRLSALKSLELPARSKQEVQLVILGSDVEAFRGEVEVRSENESQKVFVSSMPKPGELKIISPPNQEIDLGTIGSGSESSGLISVLNIGGSPLLVEANVLTPFSLDTQGSAFRLEPNEQKQLNAKLKSVRPGEHSAEVKFQAGGKTQAVKLKAIVLDAKKESTPEPMPVSLIPGSISNDSVSNPNASEAMMSTKQLAMQALLASTGMPTSSDRVNAFLERVQSIELWKREATSLSVAWKKPQLPPVGWRLEQGGYMQDERTHLAMKVWQPFKDLKPFDAGADKIGVIIGSLTPTTQYDIRIVSFDREGKISEPSPIFTLNTAAPWKIPTWFWRGLIFLVLSAALFALYRVRMSESM